MKKQSAFLSVLLLLCLSTLLYAGGNTELSAEKADVPQRIISLSPTATEILFAVGAGEQVISRTDFCNYPEQAADIPSIGGFDGKSFSIEAVIALNPDFVYATKGMHDHLEAILAEYDIALYISDAQSLDAIFSEIQDIAKITGHAEQGQKVVDKMQLTIDSVAAAVKNQPMPNVYWEVWNAPYMSAGAASYMTEVIELAGGKNIFSDIPEAYPVVSEESIIVRNPDAIIAPDSSGRTAEVIAARIGWDRIKAVQSMTIYFFESDIISRHGPRSALAVQLIAQKLFPHAEI